MSEHTLAEGRRDGCPRCVPYPDNPAHSLDAHEDRMLRAVAAMLAEANISQTVWPDHETRESVKSCYAARLIAAGRKAMDP